MLNKTFSVIFKHSGVALKILRIFKRVEFQVCKLNQKYHVTSIVVDQRIKRKKKFQLQVKVVDGKTAKWLNIDDLMKKNKK